MKPMNRRTFLSQSVQAGGAAVATSALAGALHGSMAANEKLVIAVMGVRGRGKALVSEFAGLEDVEVAAVCDIDESVLPAAVAAAESKQGKAPRTERDFRRLLDDPSIDALAIAAPDHWHALATIYACQAGKDVYVEKPVSHNLIEGRRMVEAARRYDRVVQVGTQRRSGAHFATMVDYVQSGKLGKVSLARTWIIHKRPNIGYAQDEPVPSGVDYDLWLGAAPMRPFNRNRFHYNWHWFWDYGTGELGNNGVHAIDVARWGLGVEYPTHVTSGGGKFFFDDDQQTPDTQIVTYDYPGASLVWEQRLWSTHGVEDRGFGIAFYGDQATLLIDQKGWTVTADGEVVDSSPGSEMEFAHLRNFVDCVRSRNKPNADIEVGHLSTALCHLGNIAHRTGRRLAFDATGERFKNDPEADALLGREYRPGWELPSV
jgi:predicted dehydrogenase